MNSQNDQIIQALARKLSLNRLARCSLIDDLELRELDRPAEPETASVLAHWMSLILVAGPPVRFVFKTHFQSADARILASKAYDKPPSQLTTKQAADFIKEFCNITAGALKRALVDAGIPCGISLPLMIRGFDEIFFPAAGGAWEIRSPQAKIYCSVFVEVFDQKFLDAVRLDSTGQNEDEVSFL